MKTLFTTRLGRLRLLGYLEGLSLLVLLCVATPMKHFMSDDRLTKLMGPIHGALFLVFMLNVMSLSIEYRWTFRNTIWKILIASFLPFGTLYIDKTIFQKLPSTSH